MFSACLSRNIKISTFAKASKSFSFRSDNQRQISLVLNHTCRNRKRLISLTNSQTFFEIIRLARCEYSKLVSVKSFSKKCAYIRRKVCDYSKKCVRIRTLFILIWWLHVLIYFFHIDMMIICLNLFFSYRYDDYMF
jgi:hypothetical protein